MEFRTGMIVPIGVAESRVHEGLPQERHDRAGLERSWMVSRSTCALGVVPSACSSATSPTLPARPSVSSVSSSMEGECALGQADGSARRARLGASRFGALTVSERPLNDELDVRAMRGVDVADVFKGETLAATLERSSSGIVFAYLAEYVQAGGAPVATTLAVTVDPIVTAAGAVPAFFAGLLPEGRRLTALRDALKTSLDDELSLVLAIGADPVGDVRVVPAGARPATPKPMVVWRDGADLSFRDVLAATGMLERRGMAGVQDKASAAMITVPA